MTYCQVCFSLNSPMKKLSLESRNILEILLGKQLKNYGTEPSVCLLCDHMLYKTRTLRDMCIKADCVWRSYAKMLEGPCATSPDLYLRQQHTRLRRVPFMNITKASNLCLYNNPNVNTESSMQIIVSKKGQITCFNYLKTVAIPPNATSNQAVSDCSALVKSENIISNTTQPCLTGSTTKDYKYKLDIKDHQTKKTLGNSSEHLFPSVQDPPPLALLTAPNVDPFSDNGCSSLPIIELPKLVKIYPKPTVKKEPSIDVNSEDSNNHSVDDNSGFEDESSNTIEIKNEPYLEDSSMFVVETRKKQKRCRVKINSNEGLEVNLSLEEQKRELEKKAQDKKFLHSKYKCRNCVVVFQSQETLDNHLDKHSETRGEHKCEVCHIRFDTLRRMQYHQKMHSYRIECQLCGDRLKSRLTFLQHMDLHKGNRHSCNHCQAAFSGLDLLKAHIRKEHKNIKYQCKFCSKSFSLRNQLKKHREAHSKSIKYPCRYCNEKFSKKYYLRLHEHRDHDEDERRKDNYCVECDARFSNYNALRVHYATVAKHRDPDKLIYSCDKCPKRYESAEKLQSHQAVYHERLSRFSCETCGKGYATSWGLLDHKKKVHQGIKKPLKYTCHLCGKSFTSKCILVNHIRTHTGEQPFECNICGRKFSQQTSMNTHIKLVHLRIKRNLNKTTKSGKK